MYIFEQTFLIFGTKFLLVNAIYKHIWREFIVQVSVAGNNIKLYLFELEDFHLTI